MTVPRAVGNRIEIDDGEISLMDLASVLLRWRRTILLLGFLGAVAGIASGLLTKRAYVSSATFIPQGADAGGSGVALAASQFGIRIPATNSSVWGPEMYVELVRTRAVLEPILLDTVTVAEQGGRRVTFLDLLDVHAPSQEQRLDLAVNAMRGMIGVSEAKNLGAVVVTAATSWPSVSLQLAGRLLQRVNEFNIATRRSRAVAERQFVEAQASESERALHDAEERLLSFLQSNREIAGSPELQFQRTRLERDVTLRQGSYSSWLQSSEEARIGEIRDTPVITVLEQPRLPFVGTPRNSLQKGVLGGLAGVMMGMMLAFGAKAMSAARQKSSVEAREFFALLDETVPHFVRRRRPRSLSDGSA